MAGLGAYLNRVREERGLSIDDVARATRVAPRYLRALEEDDLAALPASVFTKGYIRAYCQALDLPADEALARYAGASDTAVAVATAPIPASASSRAADSARRSRGTLWLSFALLVGFGAALFAVTLMRETGRPHVARRADPPPAPAAQASPAPQAAPAPQAGPSPSAPTAPPPREPEAKAEAKVESPPAPLAAPRVVDAKPAPVVEPPPAAAADLPVLQLGFVASPYRLVARTVEVTWLRVRTDDGRATEETIPAGEVREWISNRPFVLTIGNAAGVALELNGQKLPPLGGRGVVISRLILPPAVP